MNEPRVRAIAEYNGWRGEFRKLHRSGWFPVEVNGIAQLFASEADAKIAAYEAMTRHHFGDGILRDGDRVSIARQAAEERFSKAFPGKGRVIEVERR